MSRDTMMVSTEALFELHGKDGHVWRLFEDGRAEGFPQGTVVLNGAAPLLAELRFRKRDRQVLLAILNGLGAFARELTGQTLCLRIAGDMLTSTSMSMPTPAIPSGSSRGCR